MQIRPDLLNEMITALPDPVFILSESGRYVGVAGGRDPHHYHDGSRLVGLSLYDVLPREKADWFVNQISHALAKQELCIVEYGLAALDVKQLGPATGPGGEIWFEGRIQPLRKTCDDERAVVWVARNITQRHKLEEKLRRLSEIDPLTEIANRRKFLNELHDLYAEFKRYGHPTAMLMFDIDHFKNINDSFGHLAGDQVLFRISRIAEEHLRQVDLLCRFGGEEFAVLLPHTDTAGAQMIAERLREAIARHVFNLSKDGIKVTISTGLSQLMTSDQTANDVIKRADDALYRAKNSGRNCVVSA